MRRGAALILALGFAFAVFVGVAARSSLGQMRGTIQTNAVKLQGLDKITARVFEIEARIGELFRFGTLEIIVQACEKTPPTEPPENAAFLDIVEVRPGERPQNLFQGWMFSSSPAVSALEHPVYDVWVVECTKLDS